MPLGLSVHYGRQTPLTWGNAVTLIVLSSGAAVGRRIVFVVVTSVERHAIWLVSGSAI